MSAFCGVGEFKVHISFFAETNGAESLIVDSVITSRADSAAFVKDGAEADAGSAECLRRDLSTCDL